LAKVSPKYLPPPDIPPMGADILAWGARKQKSLKFSKTEVILMKN
jgi:hypothetical protein